MSDKSLGVWVCFCVFVCVYKSKFCSKQSIAVNEAIFMINIKLFKSKQARYERGSCVYEFVCIYLDLMHTGGKSGGSVLPKFINSWSTALWKIPRGTPNFGVLLHFYEQVFDNFPEGSDLYPLSSTTLLPPVCNCTDKTTRHGGGTFKKPNTMEQKNVALLKLRRL